jgi:hypothetical protein
VLCAGDSSALPQIGEHICSHIQRIWRATDREKQWVDEEEAFRHRDLNQLMELYQAGSQTASSEA